MNTFIISTMVMGGLIFGFVLGVAFTLWQTEMLKKDESMRYKEKIFSYLDGCADGMREERKDTRKVLENIKKEIEQGTSHFAFGRGDVAYGLEIALSIINKHIADMRDDAPDIIADSIEEDMRGADETDN